jgi:hypothetical protein
VLQCGFWKVSPRCLCCVLLCCVLLCYLELSCQGGIMLLQYF